MRRWLALAAATLIASALAALPAAAQVAAPNPAQAVKRQLRADHGVQIAEVSRTVFDDKHSLRFRYNSRLQLGSAGPVAVDASIQIAFDPEARKRLGTDISDLESPISVTVVGGRVYMTGIYELPKGKTWVSSDVPKTAGSVTTYTRQVASQQKRVNVFDPVVLRAVLKGAKAKPVSGGFLYQGTLAGPKVSWRLWTDAVGLPTRLLTSERRTGSRKIAEIERVDTRYSDWGTPLVVVPPPADEVIDYDDLKDPWGFSPAEPQELINTLK